MIWAAAWDDFTRHALDPAEVAAARSKEMEYVHNMGVRTVISRDEARAEGMKIIATRCIDINMGDYRPELSQPALRHGI